MDEELRQTLGIAASLLIVIALYVHLRRDEVRGERDALAHSREVRDHPDSAA